MGLFQRVEVELIVQWPVMLIDGDGLVGNLLLIKKDVQKVPKVETSNLPN